MNTTGCLVKAETDWSGLATVRSVVAVLRLASRKKATCGGAGLLEARRAGQEGASGRGGEVGKRNWHKVLR